MNTVRVVLCSCIRKECLLRVSEMSWLWVCLSVSTCGSREITKVFYQMSFVSVLKYFLSPNEWLGKRRFIFLSSLISRLRRCYIRRDKKTSPVSLVHANCCSGWWMPVLRSAELLSGPNTRWLTMSGLRGGGDRSTVYNLVGWCRVPNNSSFSSDRQRRNTLPPKLVFFRSW